MEWNLQKGLSLERLKSLLDVRNAGGISKAAPGAVGRQNLIGRQIRDLEMYFGARLVEKRGRVITLTDQGKNLANMAAQVAALIVDFRLGVKSARREFHIAAGGSLYDDLLARRVGGLKKERLILHLSEIKQPKIFEALQESRIDAAIAWGTPKRDSRLAQIHLGTLNYALYGHRKLLKEKISTDGVFKLPTVIVAYRDLSDVLTERCQTGEVVYVDENITAQNVIESGAYVGVLPCLLGDRLPTEFKRIDLPLLKEYSRKVSFYWNDRYAAVRQFSSGWMRGIAGMFRI